MTYSDNGWQAYIELLADRGYEPFENHRDHPRTYGVNGSAGYWCRKCRVKVLPRP